MLRLVRRHQKPIYDATGKLISGCTLTSEADRNCPGKVKCPIHLKGKGPDGHPVRESLNTRNWTVASEMLLNREAGVKPEEAKVSVDTAVESFTVKKTKTGADNKRKINLVMSRLKTFLERRGLFEIADVKLPDLVAFVGSWTSAKTTQRRDQEILKSFFAYCANADFIIKNPALHLDPIAVDRPKTDPFTLEELIAIFKALPNFADEYGRRGTPIAKQTAAFVMLLRYTGMAIGDVAKLEKSHVSGLLIRTNRKKTGEDVFAKVPQVVIDALNVAPHDSSQYFFWTGQGKIHTRTSMGRAHPEALRAGERHDHGDREDSTIWREAQSGNRSRQGVVGNALHVPPYVRPRFPRTRWEYGRACGASRQLGTYLREALFQVGQAKARTTRTESG